MQYILQSTKTGEYFSLQHGSTKDPNDAKVFTRPCDALRSSSRKGWNGFPPGSRKAVKVNIVIAEDQNE